MADTTTVRGLLAGEGDVGWAGAGSGMQAMAAGSQLRSTLGNLSLHFPLDLRLNRSVLTGSSCFINRQFVVVHDLPPRKKLRAVETGPQPSDISAGKFSRGLNSGQHSIRFSQACARIDRHYSVTLTDVCSLVRL